MNFFKRTFKYYPLLLTAFYAVYILIRINTWTDFAWRNMLLFNSILFPVILFFMIGSFLCHEKETKLFQRSLILFPLASAIFALYLTGDYYFGPPSNILTMLLTIPSVYLYWKYRGRGMSKIVLGVIQAAASGALLGLQIILTVLWFL